MLTRNDLYNLAIQLDFQSGFTELSAGDSWHAEEILGKAAYAVHCAAMDLYFAASLLLEDPKG